MHHFPIFSHPQPGPTPETPVVSGGAAAHPMRFSEVSKRLISRTGKVDLHGSHHQVWAGPVGACHGRSRGAMGMGSRVGVKGVQLWE